jgi:2-aminoadipate transaminase
MSHTPKLSFSAKALRTPEQPISYLMAAAVANPNLVNFAAGLVDAATLPVDETRKIVGHLMADPDRARGALQYDTTLGLLPLRQACLKHLEKLEGKPAAGMSLTEKDVLITTGSQQALYLIAETLLDPGDIVIVEAPSYFVYTGTLAACGAQAYAVPITDAGMDVDAVDQLLGRLEREGKLSRVKFIYCQSYYQNPTGQTLAADRRPKLYEIARKYSRGHRILVLEDAAYRELRYDGADLPSVKSYDADNRYTILTQTFSKPFSPGLRTGYTMMPPDLMAAIVNQKGNHDFGSANFIQNICLEAMRDGSYYTHVQRLRDNYRQKRDFLLAALKKYMPAGIHWIIPKGGLYVWAIFPESLSTVIHGPLFTAALDAGVLFVPGDYCFLPDETGHLPRNQMRLCFGQVSMDQIEPGIRRLAECVRELLAPGATPGPRAIPNPQVA